MKTVIIAFLLAVSSAVAPAFAADSGAAPSVLATTSSAWRNQSGSVFYIDSIGPDSQVTGRYVNNDPRYPQCRGTPYPATGWVYGNMIAWTVRWSNPVQSCNSITSWTGYFDQATSTIQTRWTLIYGSTFTPGQDVFSPIGHTESASLLADH